MVSDTPITTAVYSVPPVEASSTTFRTKLLAAAEQYQHELLALATTEAEMRDCAAAWQNIRALRHLSSCGVTDHGHSPRGNSKRLRHGESAVKLARGREPAREMRRMTLKLNRVRADLAKRKGEEAQKPREQWPNTLPARIQQRLRSVEGVATPYCCIDDRHHQGGQLRRNRAVQSLTKLPRKWKN